MKVYCFNENGYFTRVHTCQPSPLEPGKFLVPPNTTKIEPPSLNQNQFAKWKNSSWGIETHTGKYIVDGKIVVLDFPPDGTFLICPVIAENVDDLDVVGTVVTFNQQKHDERIAREAAEKLALDEAAAQLRATRQAIKDGFKEVMDQIDLIDIPSIADPTLKKTAKALKYLAKFTKDMGMLLID